MNYKNILIGVGVAAAVVALLKLVYDRVQAAHAAASKDLASPKTKKIVTQTLKQHEGEETAFVHAFAEAVEQ